MADEGYDDGGWRAPNGPPTEWPAVPGTAFDGDPPPSGGVSRRRRWPWLLGAVAGVAVAGAAGAVLLSGDDGSDRAYCEALGTRGRTDVPVIVFLLTDTTPNGVARLQAQIEDRPDLVGDVTYVGPEESLAEAQELFADSPQMRDLIEAEDLPTSLRFVVADGAAERDLRQDLDDELLVREVTTPMQGLRSVRELAKLVVDEAEPAHGNRLGGRFGHWVAPDVADELRRTAPDAVADDVDVMLEALALDEVLERRHTRAMDAVVDDAEDRCG